MEPFHSRSGSKASLGTKPSQGKPAVEGEETGGAREGKPTAIPGAGETQGTDEAPTEKEKGGDKECCGS